MKRKDLDIVSHLIEFHSLAILTGPGVYTFWRNGVPIYIGATRNGLGRPLAPTHKMAKFFKDENVTLTFNPMPSAEEAFKSEEHFIRRYKPEFNLDQKEGYRRRKMRYRQLLYEMKPVLDEETVRRLKNFEFNSLDPSWNKR